MLKENKMNIIKATYGEVDCTEQLKFKINGNKIIIRSSNDIIGDTQPGVLKYLEVDIEHENKIYNEKIKEGELLVFPKSKNNKLGIFYSNNHVSQTYPTIKKSLDTIKIAAEGKADILTCMWNHEPDNPFTEFISWTKTSSHLNQLLQIMHLLYQAKEINNYEYVSFLEHDVLYPEGYFDYPEINEGEVLTNMNYMGICRSGWQSLGQLDQPFHQMTMRFTNAIKHCESILSNALIKNAGLIEPQNAIRRVWECVNPSIHVNHGYHFTSHFNVYRKDDIFQDHLYWGSFENYKYLFEF
jgi:hypothetical protein